MAITMREIARKLNVSVATVSRALSGRPQTVSPQVRKEIQELAERCGYQKRRTVGNSVAFIIDQRQFSLSSQFYNMIIAGVERQLIAYRYFCQFHSVERGNEGLDQLNLNFPDLAGVIDVGGYHDHLSTKLHAMGVPVVLVDHHIPTVDIPAVLIDNSDGVMQACKHLHNLGHRRIAFIAGDRSEMTAQERLFGYRRAAELYGFETDPGLVEHCGGRLDEAHKAMMRILDRGAAPTAVVAHNDVTAIGVLDALKHSGIQIPNDMSVVGFDDIALSHEAVPSLTTVHVPKKRMGMTAVQRLFKTIKGKEDPFHKVIIPTTLVIRGSTARNMH
jgi:DNA-binding LacI/PurR family transcriptional regulator